MRQFLILLIFIPYFLQAQDNSPNEHSYDFWLGKWKVSWTNADGSVGSGTNHILKILDDKVIEENFTITEGGQAGFKGKSMSVYNPNTKTWHQAWADNQGGYYDFIGEISGDKKIFKTEAIEKNGKVSIQRMVFYNISENNLTWDWEGTNDGGQSWNLLWRINYEKM